MRDATREVLAGREPAALRAVCAGGQGPVLVLVDAEGRPVRPAISWLDSRSEGERARLSERLGFEVSEYGLVPRLAWVANYEPRVLDAARWALQAWDFVGFRLSGAHAAAASTFPGGQVWPPVELEADRPGRKPARPAAGDGGCPVRGDRRRVVA